ncbi:ABC transporter substrate-binding protein [Nonomuraea zeae]|uniref:ABC transporter substrate-binding protein n=1 Tax=Nonomuraea zeae TaxID=1642303 RepID=A0A5S4G1B0_9ACTN|nr:ABC transporter substrate-binding protein [Nonomuraea zeae]TMR26748.1 ABC transporter substrate-binding protein [Nonomuraea zeae]
MASLRHLTITVVAAATLIAITSCATDTGSGPSGAPASSPAGQPVPGGTLRLVGSGDVDHLDPASAYYTVTSGLIRGYARQLFALRGVPPGVDTTKGFELVPDVAAELPTAANGGLSADKLTYTIKLRDGVQWDTQPPRQVTAGDFVRGFKRLCNPVAGSGAPGYYTSTIKGMAGYCAAYADTFKKAKPTAPALAAYQNEHDIAGVQAKDDRTLVFTLTQPAGDFLNILSLNFSSAAPAEYDQYVPDDAAFRRHVISNGPYRISSYVAAKSLRMERNPAWKQESDPIRHQYVNAVEVKMGVAEPDAVQQQLEAGSADLAWDLPVPTSQIPRLKRGDPGFHIFPGAVTNPYLVFNLQSKNESGAMGKLKVRQAIEYAINKVAIAKIYGGSDVATPLHTAIPPGNIGYQEYNPYPTPGDAGDPARCRQLLSEAGYPNGLTLIGAYRNAGNHPANFQSYSADLKQCGITVKGLPVRQGDYYGAFLQNTSIAKASKWDISAPGWVPDWYGNNGRSTMQPLFQTNCNPGTSNYGCYRNPKVDGLIEQALTETDTTKAAALWHQADQAVMADAVIVPFNNQNTPIYHNKRVRNALYLPAFQLYDITNLWLSPNTP